MDQHPLLNSLALGSVTARNRLVLGPHRTNLAERGTATRALTEYYLARARGGVGAIIIGELSMMPNDRPYAEMIELYKDQALNDLAAMAAAIRKEGVLVLAQLNHRGFQSSGVTSRLATWGPSPMADVVNCETCQQMETQDIEALKQCYAEQAVRLKEIGFDGLEISIGPESLLRQFLSLLSNHRSDEYGGDLQGRMRLSLEVLKQIRQAVGADFTLSVELCLDEKFYGGLTPEETIPLAREIERSGLADCLAVSLGTYYNLHLVAASMHHPKGEILELALALKNQVDLPVMAGGRLGGPDDCQEAVQSNAVDMVRLVRPLVCDPDFAAKLQAGRPESIRRCAYDNQACLGRTNAHKSIGCIQNPKTGKETKAKTEAASANSMIKKAVVVGAGPAGLAVAAGLARRGIQVQLYDQADQPGGQLLLASKQPGRAELAMVIQNLLADLQLQNVPLHLGRKMDKASVLALNPDAIIIATGSRPHPKPVPGIYGPPKVLNVWQVLDGQHPVGERVLIIDENGHHQATGTAEYLADQGKRVEISTSEPFVGLELAGQGDIVDMRQRLLSKGVVFNCDAVAVEIKDSDVLFKDKFSERTWQRTEFDTVVLATGNEANDDLYHQLKGHHSKLMRVGDCVAPRKIGAAVAEGFRTAMEV